MLTKLLVLDLKITISYKKNLLVKLCFSLNFIPLDPDPDPSLLRAVTRKHIRRGLYQIL